MTSTSTDRSGLEILRTRPISRQLCSFSNSAADADAARTPHQRRARRLERVAREDRERHAGEAHAKLDALQAEPQDAAVARKRAIVEAAIARARARLEGTR